MKLKEFDKEKVTLELTQREFHDLVSAIFSVDQEFEILDHVILNVPLDRIEKLRNSFSEASNAQAEYFRHQQENAAR